MASQIQRSSSFLLTTPFKGSNESTSRSEVGLRRFGRETQGTGDGTRPPVRCSRGAQFPKELFCAVEERFMGRNGFVECRAHNAFGLRPQNILAVIRKRRFLGVRREGRAETRLGALLPLTSA